MDAAGSLNLIGYAGSAIAILSFLAASSARQRLINAIGCLILVFYCYSMHAYPTTICNAFTCALDLVILARLLGSHKHNYSVVDSCVSDGVYKAFVKKHASDIAKYYPQFQPEDPKQNFVRFILSDDEIAGLQVGIQEGELLHLTADYSIPAYRDCSVGRYAYSHMEDTGSKLVNVSTPNAQAKDYLRHVGFRGQGGKLALRLNYAHRGA